MTEVIAGPLWAARNWNIEDGAGSIHDDDTAAELGFRGGTVAGDIHMNQFPPILVEVFGNEWFERGNLSLNFKKTDYWSAKAPQQLVIIRTLNCAERICIPATQKSCESCAGVRLV